MFLYLIMMFIVPVIFSIFLNFNSMSIGNVIEEYKYFWKIIKKIFWTFLLIFFIRYFLSGQYDDIHIEMMFINTFYVTGLISFVILINYFSTRYQPFRNNIRNFLDGFSKFLEDNFILNLIFIVVIVYIKNSKDLTIGLIGSYIFFMLESIHKNYKRENVEHKAIYKILQIVLNIFLVLYVANIEKVLSMVYQNRYTINYIYSIDVTIFILLILLNSILSFKFEQKNKSNIYREKSK